jgi:hypothetical protein
LIAIVPCGPLIGSIFDLIGSNDKLMVEFTDKQTQQTKNDYFTLFLEDFVGMAVQPPCRELIVEN